MKKKSMIFRMICLALAAALCFSVITAFAEDTVEIEEVVNEEIATDVAEEVEDATEAEDVEDVEEATDVVEEEIEETTDVVEEEVEEEQEVLDLFTATLRDNGVYVTPGTLNAAVFTHEGLRYKVAAGTGNAIKLDGFESNPTIESEPISENDKNRLQANGEITIEAAHSGYFGLSVAAGDVVYRTGVTENTVYVFSAWVKMPSGGSINDNDRAFKVVAESGNEYIVGWNEIGRDVASTKAWQQILFTFKAPETGLFEINFAYKGKDNLSLDDLELYEAEVFDNPLDITSVVATDAEGNVYATGNEFGSFTTSGTLTHTTTLYNSDEDDVYFTAVMVLYKNDIMIDFDTIEECALVLDETEVTFEIEIPEDEDLSQYKYMVYFISDTAPTQYYGYMPSRSNPYVVQGK